MTNGTEKKGMGPLAWIGIGCGGLVLIAIAGAIVIAFKAKEFVGDIEANPAKTVAEMAVKLNPELDLISTDDDAGTVTFRNNKTGEEATMNFEDIAEGKWSITTEEGEFTVDAAEGGDGGVTVTTPEGESRLGASTSLDDVPEWVPLYPDATQTQSTYNATTAQGVAGSVLILTQDNAKKVAEYYKQHFEEGGYTITAETSSATPQGGFASIMGELAGRTVAVGAIEQGGATQVTINYNAQQ